MVKVKSLVKEKYLFLFVIGSVVGAIYEDLLEGFRNLGATGIFSFNVHRGVIYGPFNIIYGAGAVLMVYLLSHTDQSWYKIFLKGSIIGGSFEYLVSLLQEVFVGTTSWDYSNLPLNINGRTTLPIMFFWGLACVGLMKFIYPKVSLLVERMQPDLRKVLYVGFVVFLSLDMFISWTALIRQDFRRRGCPPKTFVGQLYDKYYTDDFLKKYYANMVEK